MTRSNLADANERRDWRIHCAYAQALIRIARRLYAGEPLAVELDNTVYALDSTTIKLCLTLFPWAPFRSAEAAIKLHTLLDLRGAIPRFIHISDGTVHDINVLDLLVPEAGAFYVMDRAYVGFARLHALHRAGSFFVTRPRANAKFRRVYSLPVDRSTGLICDQQVELIIAHSQQRYPERLRRIRFRDPDTGKTLVFLTNHFELPALSICALYKSRWQVELFFKWIEQHLRIKRFFGNLAERRQEPSLDRRGCLCARGDRQKATAIEALAACDVQILSVTPFEKVPLFQLFSEAASDEETLNAHNQLILI